MTIYKNNLDIDLINFSLIETGYPKYYNHFKNMCYSLHSLILKVFQMCVTVIVFFFSIFHSSLWK